MKKCYEVMTKDPFCCLSNDSVEKAAIIMQRENVGAIPVIDTEHTRKLVGIVTDRDLALMVIGGGLDPKSTKVNTVMTHNLISCFADDDLQKALDAMAKHQLRRIPVVATDNTIVGIIAQADVATRLNEPGKTAEMVREISEADGR